MVRLSILPFLAAICVPVTGARAQTLAEAIARAYRNNPELGASRYDVRVADEDVAQSRSLLRPTADVELASGYDRSIRGGDDLLPDFAQRGSTTLGDSRYALTFTQPLTTFGRASAERRAAEASAAAAREGLRGAEGDLLLAVVAAFLDVRRFVAQVAVWRRTTADLQDLVREIDARREAGELTRTDVAQATGQLAQSRQQLVAAEQLLADARADYRALVGEEAGELAPPPALPLVPPTLADALAEAEGASPELGRATAQAESSLRRIAAERASRGPTLTAQGSVTAAGRDGFYERDRSATARLVLTMPILAGGRISSRIRQAGDRATGDALRLEAARRQLGRDVARAWNGLAAAGRLAALVDSRVAEATVQLDGMEHEYRVGLRSTFDVLYAQQTLNAARVQGLDVQRDRYVAEATLLRRVGMLEVGRIVDGVPTYDPLPHLGRAERRGEVPWRAPLDAADRAFSPEAVRPDPEEPAAAIAPVIRARARTETRP